MPRRVDRVCTLVVGMLVMLISCAPTEEGVYIPPTLGRIDTCVVLTYGPGGDTLDRQFSSNAFSNLAIPELVVYSSGLVVFSCRDESWPGICQNKISPARVVQLLEDLAAVGFFNDSFRRYPEARIGPRTYYRITAQTCVSGTTTLDWSTASYGWNPQQQLQPLDSALAILDSFTEENEIGKQLYEPSYIGLWVGASKQCISGWSWCADVESLPVWPFGFSPPANSLEGDCHWWEVPQVIEAIETAVPSFRENSPSQVYGFRDGSSLLKVEIRPYLPGEAPVTCVFERWKIASPPGYTGNFRPVWELHLQMSEL